MTYFEPDPELLRNWHDNKAEAMERAEQERKAYLEALKKAKLMVADIGREALKPIDSRKRIDPPEKLAA